MIRNHLFLCLFGICGYFATSTVARETILNGDIAQRADQFPYFVSLIWHGHNDEHAGTVCGGGIIGDEFILTAAHCIFHDHRAKIGSFYVLAGTNDLEKTNGPTAVKRKVKVIFIPIQFVPRLHGPMDDIAVLKLSEPLGLSHNKHLTALKLPGDKSQTYNRKHATIMGFGWNWVEVLANDIERRGNNSDGMLRFANALVVFECHQSAWTSIFGRAGSQTKICAKIEQCDVTKPRGICNGDSGSPLVYDGIVIGVASTGANNCAELQQAGIYTRVAYHLSFIEHAMDDDNYHHEDVRAFEHH